VIECVCIGECLKKIKQGIISLIGGGETSSFGKDIFEFIFKRNSLKGIAILETPAGFELNSHMVATKIANFISNEFYTYNLQVEIIPARKRNTQFSPDDPKIVDVLADIDMVFLGPGSPTYAVRQLKDSLAWKLIKERHAFGTHLIFSSAATAAIGKYVIPVYEIYKVGEELHWCDGLDLFNLWGQSIVFVPHWNNTDGGNERDTSRCYIGKNRYDQLANLLPLNQTVVGVDENTALIIDVFEEICHVIGEGKVIIDHVGQSESDLQEFINGDVFDLAHLFKTK